MKSEATQGSAVTRAIEERLDADSRRREQSIAAFTALLSLGCALFAVALGPTIGWRLSLTIAGVLAAMSLYYAALYAAVARGHYHPALAWLNVAIEVSVPAAIMAVDAYHQGPEYALTAPPMTIWGAMVMLSSLRNRSSLAWAAGALAAIEYLTVYAVFILPRMPADALVTLTPPFVAIRAFLLFSFGPLTAIVSRYVLRRMKAAIEEVRANDLLGKYLLHERIGMGGMAEVFRATYSPAGGFEKAVAVKRVLPAYAEDEDFVTLFREEAALGSQLNHPNIVQVLDLVRREDTLFLAMEFVDGASLKAVLRALGRQGRTLPLRAATFLAAEVAAALDYLHAKTGPEGHPLNLIHRDLNPPNILVSRFGDVKVADFGIARASGRALVTRADQIRGKAAYMAPEQAQGRKIDGRIDVFALGLTLHEMLTGHRPLKGDDETALMRASVEQHIPAPSTLRAEVPPALDALLASLLERDPQKRIATGGKIRDALLLLPEQAAPYPHGRAELAVMVRSAVEQAARATGTPLLSQAVTADGGRSRPTEAAAVQDEATVTAAVRGPP